MKKSDLSINTKLVNAVLKQMNATFTEFKENVNDYRNASGGINGFIYYAETHEFSMNNQSLIIEQLENDAENMGTDVIDMVANFGIFRGDKMDKEDTKDLYNFLGGNKKTQQGTITNVLAWYCVEMLAYEVINLIEA